MVEVISFARIEQASGDIKTLAGTGFSAAAGPPIFHHQASKSGNTPFPSPRKPFHRKIPGSVFHTDSRTSFSSEILGGTSQFRYGNGT